MEEYEVIDLESAATLIEALVLLDKFLSEIRATIHVLEAFQDLDDRDQFN